MFYLMKNDTKVMEFAFMECTIYEKELLPKELINMDMYQKQIGNMFFLKTNDCDKMFEYALSFVEDKNQHISKMDSVIEELITKKIVNLDGYWFEEDNFLFYLSLEE